MVVRRRDVAIIRSAWTTVVPRSIAIIRCARTTVVPRSVAGFRRNVAIIRSAGPRSIVIRTSAGVSVAGAAWTRNVPVVRSAGAIVRTIVWAIVRLSWTGRRAAIVWAVRLAGTIVSAIVRLSWTGLTVWLTGAIFRSVGLTGTISRVICLARTIALSILSLTSAGRWRIGTASRAALQRFNLSRRSGVNRSDRRRCRASCCTRPGVRPIRSAVINHGLTGRYYWAAYCLLRRPVLNGVSDALKTLSARLNVSHHCGRDPGISKLPGIDALNVAIHRTCIHKGVMVYNRDAIVHVLVYVSHVIDVISGVVVVDVGDLHNADIRIRDVDILNLSLIHISEPTRP